MISRREFLGMSLSAGATLALSPELLRAFQQSGGLRQAQAVPSLSRDGTLIQRAIPSSGEMLRSSASISGTPRRRITPRSRRYQIARSALWAHPAVTGSSIIVKDVDTVICWSF